MVFLGKRGRGWKESRGLLAALCGKTMRVSGCSAPGVGMQMKRRRGLKEGFHPPHCGGEAGEPALDRPRGSSNWEKGLEVRGTRGGPATCASGSFVWEQGSVPWHCPVR